MQFDMRTRLSIYSMLHPWWRIVICSGTLSSIVVILNYYLYFNIKNFIFFLYYFFLVNSGGGVSVFFVLLLYLCNYIIMLGHNNCKDYYCIIIRENADDPAQSCG